MISRVAEHCFWMSRYLERAEDTARLLEVNQTLLLDLEVPLEQQWKPLLIISGIHEFEGTIDGEAVQNHLTWDNESAVSIASSLWAGRENARIIREVISAEMWERVNFYYLWLNGPDAKALYASNRTEFYSQVRRINQLIHGIAEGTMSHGEPWEFFRLGKYLERACQTARILDVKYHTLLPTPEQIGTPADNAQWVAILMSCSGYEAFHKAAVDAEVGVTVGTAIADFLIYDPEFPRSVLSCLRECRQAAYDISGRPQSETGNDVERELQELIGWLEARTIDDMVKTGLHEALTHVVDTTHRIGATVHRVYFDFGTQAPSAVAAPAGTAPAKAVPLAAE